MQQTRKRRILCTLLAMAMLLTLVPAQVFATYPAEGADISAGAELAPTSETPANRPPEAPTDLRTSLMASDAWSINPANLSFSWVVNDPDIDEYQTAYQIQLAATRADLLAGTNLVHDTGWVTSDQSTAVRIPVLASLLADNALYFWHVRTQDKDDAQGPWSAAKEFTTQVDWADDKSVWLEPYRGIPGTSIAITGGGRVAVGATRPLGLMFVPDNTTNRHVAWESSNPAVATVDNYGVVTGVSDGNAIITVRGGGGTLSDTITIRVGGEEAFIVLQALLSGYANFLLGTTEQILYTVTDGETEEEITTATVTFSSGDTAVVTVDTAGNVTAVGAGTTNITVTATYVGMSDTVTIPVTVVLPAVTNITLNHTGFHYVEPDDEFVLTATVSPATANQNVTWATSTPTVATVDQTGNVEITGQGTATITATAVGGMTARLEIISIDPAQAAGMADWTDYIATVSATYTIPNPAQGAGFSFLFRTNDAGTPAGTRPSEFYFWEFAHQPNTLRMHRNTAAPTDVPLPVGIIGPERAIAYTFAIIDGRVTTFVDGIAVDHNRPLPGPIHQSGRIGFRAGWYKAFTVHAIDVVRTDGGVLYYADFMEDVNTQDWLPFPNVSHSVNGLLIDRLGGAPNNVLGLRTNYTPPASSTPEPPPAPAVQAMVAELPGNDRFDHELRNFIFMRHEFELDSLDGIERAIMSAAAHNTENSCQHIFDLYLNADHVGLGPARIGFASPTPHAFYNSFDVTEFLQVGENVIGVMAHDKGSGLWGDRVNQTGGPSRMFMLELRLYFEDGTSTLITSTAEDYEEWLAMDGTRAFGDRGGNDNVNNAGWYNIRREHMNANHFPFGWNTLEFEPDWQWRPMETRTATGGAYYRMSTRRAGGLLPYHGGNMMRHRITDGPDGNGHGMDFTWTDHQGITSPGREPGRVTHVVNEKRVIPFTAAGQDRFVVDLAQNIVGGLEIYLGDLLLDHEGDVTLNIRLAEYKPWYREQTGHFPTNHTGSLLRGNNTDGWVRSGGWGHPPYSFDWTFRGGEYNPPMYQFNMMNFRWVEINGLPAGLEILPQHVTGIAFRQPFDYDAHDFSSSDPWLDNLYEYARYAIKATTQCLWTDTKARERRAYEGDALVNMLMHNAFSANYTLGRHTHEHMLFEQTWPMEYRLYSIEKAWWDYLFTGCDASIEQFYDTIHHKFHDTDGGRSQWDNTHGLYVLNQGMQNDNQNLLIDWPANERDNHQRTFGRISTVHNAVASGAHTAMANIAELYGNETHRAHHQLRADRIRESLVDTMLIEGDGYSRFSDAANHTNPSNRSNHTAQHSVSYPLAYGVFADLDMAADLAAWVERSGGFRTSIFSSYFTLRGLYNAGAGDVAMEFLTGVNPVDQRRSFHHVLTYLRATTSPESWCYSLKWNSTMSHPWGATPAIAISMGVFGIEPLAGGFSEFQVRLQPGGLEYAEIRYPTIRGPVDVAFENGHLPNLIEATVTIPANTRAQVSLPVTHPSLTHLIVDGVRVEATRVGNFLMVELGSGERHVKVDLEDFLEVEVELSQSTIEVDRIAELALVSVVNELRQDVMGTATVEITTYPTGIVTVSPEGIVIPITTGTTEILITVTDTRGISETARIPITIIPIIGPDRIVEVEIRLDAGLEDVDDAAQATLVAIRRDGTEGVPPFANVVFRSTDPAVATVTPDGLVTLLQAEGEFTIEARTTEHFELLVSDFDFERFEIAPIAEFDFEDGINPFTSGAGNTPEIRDGRLFVPTATNRWVPTNTPGEWNNYMVTATMNVQAVAGSLNFRATDVNNLFMWQFRPNDNTLNPHIAPGSGLVGLPPNPVPVGNFNPIGQDNQVAIAVEGDRIMTYINGVLADMRIDARHATGTIGVRTGNTESFYLDDVVVGPRVLLTTLLVDLTEPPTPVITIDEQPGDVTVTFGDITETLTVVATVTEGATLSYQWEQYVDGTWTAIENATAAEFPLPAGLAVGTHQFRVVVSAADAVPVTSRDVTVTVALTLPDNIELPPDTDYEITRAPDGTLTITIPGDDDDDIIIAIAPDGEMTVDLPGGGTVTVPDDSEFALDEDGDVTITVSVDEDEEIVITVPDGGDMEVEHPGGGTVTVPPDSKVEVDNGDLLIRAPSGDGDNLIYIYVPGDDDHIIMTFPYAPRPVVVPPSSDITVDEDGEVAVTVPEDGTVTMLISDDEDEIEIELPGGGDVVIAPDGEVTITVPEAGGTITLPDGKEYEIPGNGTAVITPEGDVIITGPVAPTLTLTPAAVTLSNAADATPTTTETVAVGGSATGAITLNTTALPTGVTATVVDGAIVITGTRPAYDGATIPAGPHPVTVTREGISETLCVTVNLTPLPPPVTTYTVTFASNGGGGTMAAVQVEAGTTFRLPTNGFTPPTTPAGRVFLGWFVGTETVWRQADFELTVTGDVIVTAQWSAGQVLPENVPVTGITGVPDSMVVGDELELTGTVAPANATNRDIVWSTTTSGASIEAGVLTTTRSGPVVVTATIVGGNADGTDFVQEFTVIAREFHAAYMFGNPAGQFLPGNSITRAEVAAILARTMIDDFDSSVDREDYELPEGMESFTVFPDVSESNWFYHYVAWAHYEGFVQGDAQGRFNPNSRITRQELAAMLARTIAEEDRVETGSMAFPDADTIGGWARGYVYNVFRQGWMVGDTNGNFRPGADIMRAEVATAVNRLLGRVDTNVLRNALVADDALEHESRAREFPDVAASNWFFAAVLGAANDHYLTHDDEGVVDWMYVPVEQPWR